MECIFPGAGNLGEYWANLRDGVDAIEPVPPSRWDPVFYDPESSAVDRFYCRRGGFVDPHASFDALGFGVMPIAALGAEPDQLLGLQVASAALADAGYLHRPFPRERTAVILGRGNYIGAGMNRLEQHVRTAEQLVTTLRDVMPDLSAEELARVKGAFQSQLGSYGPDTAIGLVPNLTASRVANRLNLQGTAYTVDGACASSLLALDHGVRELRDGRADMVLVGGVHLSHDVAFWSVFCQLGALSRTEGIRPFSQDADGILIGEGLGFVVLKREDEALAAGDRIYATIRGVGISSDGRGASLMNPSKEGQLLALDRAWKDADLSPDTIGMVEAHGTGTPVGDGVELDTLRTFFGPDETGREAALGSVKSMIGHAMPAAGMAGLIKASLALYEKTLLPTLHASNPHPLVEDSRFRLLPESEPWDSTKSCPRRAAVNAFGFGGINAHVVLEEAPDAGGLHESVEEGVAEALLVISASSPEALLEHLATLEPGTTGRIGDGGPSRLALVDPSSARVEKADAAIRAGNTRRGRGGLWYSPEGLIGKPGNGVAFLFPGIEANFEPRVLDVARHFGKKPPSCLRPRDLEEQGVGVVGLGRLLHGVLHECGVQETHMVGHSVGEWTAMIASQRIDESAVDSLIGGFESGTLEVPGVVFLAVGAGFSRIKSMLQDVPDVHLSHDNCPHQTVVVGPVDGVETFENRLKEARIYAQRLPFQSGFHSPLFRDYIAPHQARFDALPLGPGTVPLWSTTHAAPFPTDPEGIRALAIEHLVEPVRFRETLEGLYKDGVRTFVQVGPGSLVGFVQDTLKGKDHLAVSTSLSARSGLNQLRRALAALYVEGLPVKWGHLLSSSSREIPLELGVPLVRMEPSLVLSRTGSALPEGADITDPVVSSFLRSVEEAQDASRAVIAAYAAKDSSAPSSVRSPEVIPKEKQSGVRFFSIEEHPHLLDHTFFRQPAEWPELEDRYPVVPMTALIEEMKGLAESAHPAQVAVQIKEIRARKWVAVEPPLRVNYTVETRSEHESYISFAGYTDGLVVCEETYRAPTLSPFEPIQDEREVPVDAVALYQDRWMFHGPAYQGVVSLEAFGSDGIRGVIRTGEAPGALLDNAGQLLGLWVMLSVDQDRLAMPVQIQSIDLYGPHPAPGEEVVCDVRIRTCKSREVIADMYCTVGGRPWAFIQGWEDWRFETDSRLWPLLQYPERHLLAQEDENGNWCMDLSTRSRRGLEDLSRRFLGKEDRAQWLEMSGDKMRSWLAGRIAAIDAVRGLLFQAGKEAVFPVEVRISNGIDGAPEVSTPFEDGPLFLSIAHKDGKSIARASFHGSVGVDIEKVTSRTEGFERLAFSDKERALLPAENREEWLTRLWSAKESLGKFQRTGLRYNPKGLELDSIEGECFQVDGVWVETRLQGDYVVAWTREEKA